MSRSELYRLSGLSVLVGTAVALLTFVYSAFVFVGDFSATHGKPGFVIVNLLQWVAVALVLLGLPMLYASIADRAGLPGLIGTALIFLTGLMFGIFFPMLSALIVPYLADKAPQVFKGSGPPGFLPYLVVGTIASVIGPVLLAIPFLGDSLQPRWVGYTLVGSALFAVVSFFINSQSSNLLASIVNTLSPILLFVSLGSIAYSLVNGRGEPHGGSEADQNQPISTGSPPSL